MATNVDGPESTLVEHLEEDTFEVREYWQALVRRKWIIISFTLVALTFALITSQLATPIYEATATVMVNSQQGNSQFMLFEALGAPGKNTNQNYLEVLKSWSLAERAWKSLGNQTDLESPAFMAFKGSISLQLVPGTDAIRIKVLNKDPNEAKRIANAVVASFIESNQEVNTEEARKARAFIEQQLSIVESDLRKAEDELQQYKERTKIVAPSEEAKAVITRLTDLERGKAETVVLLSELQRQLKELQQKLKTIAPTHTSATTVSNNPAIAQYKSRISELEIQLALAQSQYGNDHPRLETIKIEIQSVRQLLSREIERVVGSETIAVNPNYQMILQQSIGLEVEIVAKEARRDALQKQISQVEITLASLPQEEAQLSRLIRNQSVSEQVYLLLKTKREDYRISEAVKSSGIGIIDYARATKSPVKPKKKQNVMIAGLLGIFLGVGLALLLEFMDTSLKNSDDVERHLNLSCMGSIPQFGASKKRGEDVGSDDLVSLQDPKSPVAEAFRTLRTNLQYVNASGDVRTVMMTSAGPGEGKSTISANLGCVLAQSGKRVTIVGVDLRKPTLHRFFRLSNRKGLTSVLAGKTSLDECLINVDGIDNLCVLPSGPIPPNPAELLGSDRMTDIISELARNADIVLFDAPPVIAVTDAAILAQKIDGVLMIANAGISPREHVIRSKDQLSKVGARILGVILNRVSVKDGYGYYYYYYSDESKKTEEVS